MKKVKKEKKLILKKFSVVKIRKVFALTHTFKRPNRFLSRTEKLINLLVRCGIKERIRDAVNNVKIMIAEHFHVYSSSLFLETLLQQLEPICEVKIPPIRNKRKRQGQKVIPYITFCSPRRRTYLGLKFLVDAMRIAHKKQPLPLEILLMNQIFGIYFHLSYCTTLRLKRLHTNRLLLIYSQTKKKKSKCYSLKLKCAVY